jgi:hypothetical protein
VASGMKRTHCGKVARRKRNWTRDKVVRGTSKGRTFGRRQWRQEGGKGIKDLGGRRPEGEDVAVPLTPTALFVFKISFYSNYA